MTYRILAGVYLGISLIALFIAIYSGILESGIWKYSYGVKVFSLSKFLLIFSPTIYFLAISLLIFRHTSSSYEIAGFINWVVPILYLLFLVFGVRHYDMGGGFDQYWF